MNRHFLYSTLLCASLLLAACGDNGNDSPPNPPPSPPENAAPVADAGQDQIIPEGYAVILVPGPGTADSDGTIASYQWRQTEGPQVELNTNPNECPQGQACADVHYEEGTAIFVAPAAELPIALEFEFTVTDDDGAESAADSVTITVEQLKFFGTAPGGESSYQHLTTYFDQITPENAGKWASVEPERDQMNWADLDTAYNFAQNHGLRFKFHTLIWGQQQPAWLDELTSEEQLEEIGEWMAAVAERYPQLDMIDVVNEPLHAPPAYKGALGGDGESGWDWLIKAFEMARAHFPDSKLILNDYNILVLEQFTSDYLAVIEVLHSRGLLDGIGVQAHFLERTGGSVVSANLDALAATGLPIYVSELDLNFTDDAQQANVMRELFPVFWEHPAVAGVTHWGHLQGTTWRENAYLLRAHGTERPALQWLNCFMAGENDCDHLVPEFIPSGWAGGEFGLTLEAELYDEGQGLIASGNQVAFTDDGDWIAFRDVEFQQGWDSFWVNYAKGNEEIGSISIHLDDLESEPVLTTALEPTAGWSSFDTLELPWQPLAGTRDIYVRFSDAEGVANIDWLRIGKPQPVSDENLVVDGGFEGEALSGWSSWDGSTLELTTDQAQAGEQSLLVTDRTDTNSNAVYNLTSAISPDTTYPVSAWVLHTGGDTDTVRLAAKVECSAETEPDGHNTFPWLDNNENVTPSEWTQLSANLVIPDCDVVDVAIFFEATSAGEDVYIDEVKVLPPPDGNLVADGGFEGAAPDSGWSVWWNGGTNLAVTDEQAAAGAQSLRVSNRAENSHPSYDLTGLLDDGASYAVSAQVRHAGPETTQVTLTAKLACSDGDSFINLADESAAAADTWTQLSGTLEVPPDCGLGEARIYFENTPLEIETLYIDEVSTTPL